MHNQKDFFHLFINVVLGLVIIALIHQFIDPLNSSTVLNMTSDIYKQNIDNKIECTNKRILIVQCDSKIMEDYWKNAKEKTTPGFLASDNQINTYVESINNLIKQRTKDKDVINLYLKKGETLKNKLIKIAHSRQLLIFIVFLFVIKYVHESVRIDRIISPRRSFNKFENFLLFISRITMLIFIILLASFITGELSWKLMVLIFGGFTLQDLILRLKFKNNSSNCNDFRYLKTVTNVWLFLDFTIFIAMIIIRYLPEMTSLAYGNEIINGNAQFVFPVQVYFWVLIIQIFTPYVGRLKFYFSDDFFPTETEAVPSKNKQMNSDKEK